MHISLVLAKYFFALSLQKLRLGKRILRAKALRVCCEMFHPDLGLKSSVCSLSIGFKINFDLKGFLDPKIGIIQSRLPTALRRSLQPFQ